MTTISRREMCLSVLASTGIAMSHVAFGQNAPDSPVVTPGTGTVGPARAITLEQMQERRTATGESWAVAHGTLPTGETVNLHASMQHVGAPAVQLHVIHHSEFILVREGELEFHHEVEGKVISERASAGSVLYIPYGTRHAVRNVGSVPAHYLVVGIGGDAK